MRPERVTRLRASAGVRDDWLRHASRRARPMPSRLGYLRGVDGDDDEPRTADGRREGAALARAKDGYRPVSRRTASPSAAPTRSHCCRSACTWRNARAGSVTTTRASAASWPGARRRRPAASDDRQRRPSARPRARGVPEPVRRTEDARANRLHAEDGQDVEELMIAKGIGEPIVLIPGIQGRWEWMTPRSMRSPGRIA